MLLHACVAWQLARASAAHECYEAYPTLASCNDLVRFPLLTLLRRLATHARE